MKRWFGKLGIGSVFVLIGVAALAGGAFSLATRDSSEATAKKQSTDRDGYGPPPWVRNGMRHFRGPSSKEMKQRREEFESDLADELGVSQEKVHEAFHNLMKKRLDQAVKDGRLTQKQADKILECHDTGNCDGMPFGPGGPHGGGPPGGGGPPMGGPPM
jgi:hypothetical protein